MPGRRIPPQIMAYLGNCREPNGTVEKVVEQCGLGKFMGDEGLTTYDPLVVVMDLVTEEFLGLTPEESAIVELRVTVARAVRRLREGQGLTQKGLAERIKTTQPRVARIEAAASDVSLDQMFRGLFAVGGSIATIATESGKSS